MDIRQFMKRKSISDSQWRSKGAGLGSGRHLLGAALCW